MRKHSAIFDIGKTNKKLLVFDDHHRIVREWEAQIPETRDEDGFPCEDHEALRRWVMSNWETLRREKGINLKSVNFSTYGASWMHLDEKGHPVTPLYSYFKPFPQHLKARFLSDYGPEKSICVSSASPLLGMLNSGLQLYWLKYEKPELFRKIRHSLHLPQYLSSLLTGKLVSEATSIGCHTLLWDFEKGDYQHWIKAEGLVSLFPPILPSDTSFEIGGGLHCGIGLHDSSASLAPYLLKEKDPFILLSTGTWSIALNPFNAVPLSEPELANDCLCYLSVQGKAVKAARLLLGAEYEHQVAKLSLHFGKDPDYHRQVKPDPEILRALSQHSFPHFFPEKIEGVALLERKKLAPQPDFRRFPHFEYAYHQLMRDLVDWQGISLDLILRDSPVKQVFLSGGFYRNALFLDLLRQHLHPLPVNIAEVPQASALGALAVMG